MYSWHSMTHDLDTSALDVIYWFHEQRREHWLTVHWASTPEPRNGHSSTCAPHNLVYPDDYIDGLSQSGFSREERGDYSGCPAAPACFFK